MTELHHSINHFQTGYSRRSSNTKSISPTFTHSSRASTATSERKHVGEGFNASHLTHELEQLELEPHNCKSFIKDLVIPNQQQLIIPSLIGAVESPRNISQQQQVSHRRRQVGTNGAQLAPLGAVTHHPIELSPRSTLQPYTAGQQCESVSKEEGSPRLDDLHNSVPLSALLLDYWNPNQVSLTRAIGGRKSKCVPKFPTVEQLLEKKPTNMDENFNVEKFLKNFKAAKTVLASHQQQSRVSFINHSLGGQSMAVKDSSTLPFDFDHLAKEAHGTSQLLYRCVPDTTACPVLGHQLMNDGGMSPWCQSIGDSLLSENLMGTRGRSLLKASRRDKSKGLTKGEKSILIGILGNKADTQSSGQVNASMAANDMTARLEKTLQRLRSMQQDYDSHKDHNGETLLRIDAQAVPRPCLQEEDEDSDERFLERIQGKHCSSRASCASGTHRRRSSGGASRSSGSRQQSGKTTHAERCLLTPDNPPEQISRADSPGKVEVVTKKKNGVKLTCVKFVLPDMG